MIRRHIEKINPNRHDRHPGRFLLTGSANIMILLHLSEWSWKGRTALFAFIEDLYHLSIRIYKLITLVSNIIQKHYSRTGPIA
jgi:hypothetical protein